MRTRSPVHLGAGLAPALQRRGVLDEGHADLFQHGLGIGLDDLQRLGVQDLEFGMLRSMNRAASIRTAVRSARRAAPPPPRDRRRADASAMLVLPTRAPFRAA
jgi:hypothetical protein